MEIIVDSKKLGFDLFGKLLKGYWLYTKSAFVKIDYKKLDLPVSIPGAILILMILGTLRVLISLGFGLRYLNGVWYTWDFGLFFVMFWFPVFLTFFPAMIMDYAFRSWDLKIPAQNILGLTFFAQWVHVIIPVLDWIHVLTRFPAFYFIPLDLYYKLAVSPLALTPLILLVTMSTSLGITPSWILVTVVSFRFGLKHKVPLVKLTLLLMAIFWVIYVITYPNFLKFFIYGDNFYWGMTYFVGSIGAILYFKARNVR